MSVFCQNPRCHAISARTKLKNGANTCPVCGTENVSILGNGASYIASNHVKSPKIKKDAGEKWQNLLKFLKNIVRWQKSKATTQPKVKGLTEREVKDIVDLAKSAWGSREQINSYKLNLAYREIAGKDPKQIIGIMQRHVQKIAPGFNVPLKKPDFIVKPIYYAAGTFSDPEGNPLISLSTHHSYNTNKTYSILCHEMCHYILNSQGIRKKDFTENERLTEFAMFVFGFGNIYLQTYFKTPTVNRPGHKIGYLTHAEYKAVYKLVKKLRFNTKYFKTGSDQLLLKFQSIVTSEATRARLMSGYIKKYPNLKTDEIIERIIEDIHKDNRR